MEGHGVLKSDFDKICRLCLSQDKTLTCLFSGRQDEAPLFVIAQTCAAVDIDEEDGLPPNICCACRDTILSSYQFRQQVARNDTILRRIADMKSDPGEEGIKAEAVVEGTEMPEGPPWTAGDGGSQKGKNYDPEVSLNYMFTTIADPEESDTLPDASEDNFWTNNDRPNVRKSTRTRKSNQMKNDKTATVGPENIASCSNDQWDNVKPFFNSQKDKISIIRQKKRKRSDSDSEAVHAKALELGQSVDGGHCCTPCQKVYRNKYKFYNHIRFNHLLMGGFLCDQCGLRRQFKHEISRHIKEVHLGISRKYGVVIRKNTKNNLKYYVSEEVRAKGLECGKPLAGGYHCTPCGQFFPLTREFYNHIRFKHMQCGEYSCDFCSYRSKSKSLMDQHIKTKHSSKHEKNMQNSAIVEEVRAKMLEFGTLNPDGSYYCQPCKKFYKKAVYYSHVRAIHLKIRDFMCEQCGYRAISKILLIQHIDGIHLRIRKYKCLNCPLRFFTKAKLNIHARKHLPGGIRTSMCEVCGKSLRTREDVLRHVRAQHFPELKIKCEFCDCRYASRGKLRDHIKKLHRSQ